MNSSSLLMSVIQKWVDRQVSPYFPFKPSSLVLSMRPISDVLLPTLVGGHHLSAGQAKRISFHGVLRRRTNYDEVLTNRWPIHAILWNTATSYYYGDLSTITHDLVQSNFLTSEQRESILQFWKAMNPGGKA